MDALTDFFPHALVVATLLLVALGAAPLAHRVGLPGPAAFLAVGIAAGALGIDPVSDAAALPVAQIGAIALYAILFHGGIATGFGAFRKWARPTLLLALPGTAVTAAAVAAVAHFALGLDWGLAILAGVALSPTDPAAVYATLRGQGGGTSGVRTVLEGESGLNDPIGISFMVVAVAAIGVEGAGVADGAVRLVEELGIGLAGGVVGWLALTALLRATPRLDQSLQGAAMLVGAVIVGAGTASLHGSGFLAVFLAGLLISDAWAGQDGRHHAVPESLAAVAEPVLFGLLGAAFAQAVTGSDLWQGIVLTLVTVLVVRPLVVVAATARCGFGHPDRLVATLGGLKGAVPLLLAAYPALDGLDEATRTEALVLVATATSIVVQGGGLRLLARFPAWRPSPDA